MSRDIPLGEDDRTRYRDYPFVINGEEREELEWVGVAPGANYGVPQAYDPEEQAVYKGEVDEEAEHIRIDEEGKRHLDEDETLGDHVESMAEEHGWTWLSEFAHDHLETTEHEAGLHVIHSEFNKRNVSDDADYDLGYFGSFTFRDDDGRVHTLERQFNVYHDDGDRTGTGQPRAVLKETLLTAEAPDEERRAGDAELDAEDSREVRLDIEPGAGDAAIQTAVKEWHEAHPEPTVAAGDLPT